VITVEIRQRNEVRAYELTIAQARDLVRVVDHYRRHGPAASRCGAVLEQAGLLERDGRFHHERLRWRPTTAGILVKIQLELRELRELKKEDRQLSLPMGRRAERHG